MMRFKIVSAWAFQKRIYEAQQANNKFGCCVDVKQLNYYKENCICFIAYPENSDLAIGYAIDTYAGNPGVITSVFKHPDLRNSYIDQIVTHAVNNGARRLDCFAGIAPLYEKHGFETYRREAFSTSEAPKNWNYGYLGTPDVHYMILNKNFNHKSNSNENN